MYVKYGPITGFLSVQVGLIMFKSKVEKLIAKLKKKYLIKISLYAVKLYFFGHQTIYGIRESARASEKSYSSVITSLICNCRLKSLKTLGEEHVISKNLEYFQVREKSVNLARTSSLISSLSFNTCSLMAETGLTQTWLHHQQSILS